MVEVKLIFNNRMFEDGWAEPYLVTLIFSKLSEVEIHNPQAQALKIQKCANSMLNDGISCSADGIEQILKKYQENEKRLLSWHIDIINGICFGGNEYNLD